MFWPQAHSSITEMQARHLSHENKNMQISYNVFHLFFESIHSQYGPECSSGISDLYRPFRLIIRSLQWRTPTTASLAERWP